MLPTSDRVVDVLPWCKLYFERHGWGALLNPIGGGGCCDDYRFALSVRDHDFEDHEATSILLSMSTMSEKSRRRLRDRVCKWVREKRTRWLSTAAASPRKCKGG